jgi:hypothetical protein
MIQRIQSVYLFLALLALGGLFSRLPLITLNGSAANDTLHVIEQLFIGLSAFITLFSIFLYANRKRQMMAVKGAILLTVIALFGIENKSRKTMQGYRNNLWWSDDIVTEEPIHDCKSSDSCSNYQ